MGILDWISGIFKPAADLVDELVTSDEERMKLNNELAKIKNEAATKLIELEEERLKAVSAVEIAEASSTHWIRANWRPICAMTMVGSILYLTVTKQPIPEAISSLAEVFLGAYTGGRSLEKIASVIKK